MFITANPYVKEKYGIVANLVFDMSNGRGALPEFLMGNR